MIPTSKLHVLSLDLATVSGHARLASGVITSGSQSFARHTGNKSRPPDHVGTSHAQFDNWLREQLREPRPDHVVYEAAGFFKSGAAVQMCVGLRGIVLAQTAKLGIPVFSYAPTTIKKFWAGKGTADKDGMVAATRTRLPHTNIIDANQCDALAQLYLHLSLQ